MANNVVAIQNLIEVQQWRHVSCENDTADVISIGLRPEKLVKIKLWFRGPTFLNDREYLKHNIPMFVIRDLNIKILDKVIYLFLLLFLILLFKSYFDIINCFSKQLPVVRYNVLVPNILISNS